jgi:hypothetical protein
MLKTRAALALALGLIAAAAALSSAPADARVPPGGQWEPVNYCFLVESRCAAEAQDYLDDCRQDPMECLAEAYQLQQTCEEELYATCIEVDL